MPPLPVPDAITEVLALPPADDAPARIVAVWRGGSIVREIPSDARWVVGRGRDADLRLDDVSVSRRHATLHFDAPIRIEDLGSANGTWVNGSKLAPGDTRPLLPGAVVELGSAALFLRSATEPSAPLADEDGLALRDPATVRVVQLADVVAKSKLTILLLGETGVGKEVIARRIHRTSPRANERFVAINCAALAETLLESELFGHEKGAFTGASHAKRGVVEAADKGTLFLDEIGELSAATQAKLLRVIETGTVTRVGATEEVHVDVRFVCATHRDLRAMVRDGRFRQDLYFRLEGVTVRVPPLRERPLDLPVLATRFAEDAAREAGKPPPELTAEAIERLRGHAWPGNVRELRNVMARSVVLATTARLDASTIMFSDESAPARVADAQRAPETAPDDDRRARVLAALEAHRWNQTAAAKSLGVTRRTLYNWMTDLGLKSR